jgi:hypothetical protein
MAKSGEFGEIVNYRFLAIVGDPCTNSTNEELSDDKLKEGEKLTAL